MIDTNASRTALQIPYNKIRVLYEKTPGSSIPSRFPLVSGQVNKNGGTSKSQVPPFF
jgi:hypothetical protein